jgi:hemoglobin-like flavoprotein
MTRSEIALVHDGYARIAPRADSFCLAFCHRLFDLDLSLRTLFPNDLRPLTATLVVALETLMGSLEDLQPVLARAPALGLRLASYGLRPADLPVVAAAFLGTLDDELGEAFTDAARAVWHRIFWTVALVTMDAMDQALPAAA